MSRARDSRLVYSTSGDVTQEKPGTEPVHTDGRQIRLRLDRRSSDRLVTVVTGLPGSAAELADLAKALKATCATGGSFKSGALELQGDHRERVEAALRDRGLRSKRAGG